MVIEKLWHYFLVVILHAFQNSWIIFTNGLKGWTILDKFEQDSTRLNFRQVWTNSEVRPVTFDK